MSRNINVVCQRQVRLCSWQQHRTFAQEPVASALDWDALEESVVSDEGKRELASLKIAAMEVRQSLESMSKVQLPLYCIDVTLPQCRFTIFYIVQPAEPIDWEGYEKKGVDPEVLKIFREFGRHEKSAMAGLSLLHGLNMQSFPKRSKV